MTTADWALVLSVLSFGVSLAGFVWSVWSKFIYPRAKIRSRISLMLILGNGEQVRKTISLSATNYGPTDITLHCHIAKRKQGFLCFRKNRHLALIMPVDHPSSDHTTGPFGSGFPKKLAVGESTTLYFSADAPKRWIEEANLFYFGFTDTFDRYHWCSSANAKKFRQDIIQDFNVNTPVESIWFEKLCGL